MKKRILILILCVSMLAALAGCNTQGAADTTGSTTGSTTESTTESTGGTNMKDHTPAPVEDQLPAVSGTSIRMYYDDRLALSELTDAQITAVEIKAQNVTSKITGTSESDKAVAYYREEDKTLIAVGIGTATVTVNGTEYQLSVEAAPISLFMITGHSIGAGQEGDAAQSVLCKEGTVYSSYGVKTAAGGTNGVGIGYTAEKKPSGIDAFTTVGEGTIGEGSGLAYQWYEQTGEKVWVLNAAIGGSCLNEWYSGKANYNNAVKLYQYAQTILSNEIAAGHYRLKDMAIVYHSGANFSYKNVTYTQTDLKMWYYSMWEGFKEDLAKDMDGNGEAETVTALGIVPIWTTSNNKAYNDDKNLNFYMAASEEYSDVFMASLATRSWVTISGVRTTFPDINYTCNSGSVTKPVTSTQIFAADNVHLQQVTYNAMGMNVAQNLFAHLRTYTEAVSIELQDEKGNAISDTVKLSVGESINIVPVVEPITVSDLTFTVSDNLSVSSPYIITAKSAGTGTLTIYQEDTLLATVTITVE